MAQTEVCATSGAAHAVPRKRRRAYSDDGINSSRGSSFRIEKSPGEEAAMAVLGESAKRGYK